MTLYRSLNLFSLVAAGMFCLCFAWRPLPAYLWPEMFGPEYVQLAVGDTADVGLMLRWVFLDIPIGTAAGVALIIKGLFK
jgi:hypothetical protein